MKSIIITLTIVVTISVVSVILSFNSHSSLVPVVEPNCATGTFIITGYDAGACCCGRFADGITASGKLANGLIVAAPPEIPFGVKMDIPGYGVASVEDRGSAIKGNKLDVLMKDHNSALRWGVQELKVRIIK